MVRKSYLICFLFGIRSVLCDVFKQRDDPSPNVLVISSIIVVPSQEPVTITITSTSSATPQGSDSTVESLITTAQPAANTDASVASDNCGFGTVNVDDWEKSGIDSWLAAFGQSNAGQDLVAALAHKYAPNVAQSILDCDFSNTCSPVSCQLMDLSQPDAKQAFFVLEAIANLNNVLKTIIDGITTGATLANSFTNQWVQLFSFVPQLDQAFAQRNFLINLLEGAVSFLLAFAGIYGAVASAAISFVFDGVSQSLGNPPQEFDVAADLGAYIGHLTNTSISEINNLGSKLFNGQADNSGNHLWQYLANGSFADDNPIKSSQIANFLEEQYIAAGIQALYCSQRTYIIETPLVNGVSCENDKRGPASSKLCSDALPGMVYYAYMIPPTPSDSSNYPQVTLPQGWMNLTDYPGLNLVTAMQSSVLAYHVAGFNYDGLKQQRWIEAIANASNSGGQGPIAQGFLFEGVFTLPVCGDPTGNFISQVNTDSHRRYPCQCSPASGSSSDPNAETIPFLYAAGMMHDKVWYGYCNDQSEGQKCSDPQAEGVAGGKVDVLTQNVTFQSCPFINASVKGLGKGLGWGWYLWVLFVWILGNWIIDF